jgi:hypothetical protein
VVYGASYTIFTTITLPHRLLPPNALNKEVVFLNTFEEIVDILRVLSAHNEDVPTPQ